MGKAARIRAEQRRDEYGKMLVTEAERWGQPATDLERRWLTEVLRLPRVQVTRPPDDQLLASGMVPKDCHLNCWAQQKNDPLSKHHTGWMVDGPALVLHSVIHSRDQWVCITPQLAPMPPTFEFISDPALEWVPDGNGGRDLRREGQEVPIGLRGHPEVHVEMLAELKRLVSDGVHPFDAYQQVDGVFGKRLMELTLPAVP